MTFHILNGDALIQRFVATGLTGEMIVARECLVEGDLQGATLQEFFKTRARYIKATYDENEVNYFARVAKEFEKLVEAPNDSDFNLWFGYDLFCRANMWFVLSLLHGLDIKKEVFVVYPSHLQATNVWDDFGGATPEDLKACFETRIRFSNEDLNLGNELWTAFKTSDFKSLEQLSRQKSACFPYLEEVCKAHIDRFPAKGEKGRPERVVDEIVATTSRDFNQVFKEFFKRAGIYGFGDSQVKPIYDKVMNNNQ